MLLRMAFTSPAACQPTLFGRRPCWCWSTSFFGRHYCTGNVLRSQTLLTTLCTYACVCVRVCSEATQLVIYDLPRIHIHIFISLSFQRQSNTQTRATNCENAFSSVNDLADFGFYGRCSFMSILLASTLNEHNVVCVLQNRVLYSTRITLNRLCKAYGRRLVDVVYSLACSVAPINGEA